MAGFLVATAEAIQGLQCQLLDGNEAAVNSIGRFAGPVRERALDGINATRRLLGCNPDDDPEEPPPPFTGGQCDNIQYDLTFDVTRQLSGGPSTTSQRRTVRGPVGGVTLSAGPSAIVATIVCRFVANGGLCGSTIGTGEVQARQTNLNVTVPSSGQFSISNIQIVRCDGQPDVCGDPPPDYGPPAPRPIDIDITFQPDFGPEITVPITFNFQPVEINLNGTFRIPFNFDFGGFEYSGNVNFNPTANITINPPRANPGDGQGTEAQGEDEPGETIPPAPPEQKIVGVVVTASDVESTRVSQIFNPGMTPTYAPRLGSVKFAYSLGGATFFSSDIDIKDRRTFIECPFSQGADAAIASPQPGISLTFTEIRGFPLATVDDVQNSTAEP